MGAFLRHFFYLYFPCAIIKRTFFFLSRKGQIERLPQKEEEIQDEKKPSNVNESQVSRHIIL